MGKDLSIAMTDLKTLEQGVLRDKIIELESVIRDQEGAFLGDSTVCPLTHKFAPGIYVREIFIPAGTYLVGKIHKHEHPNFLMSGTVEVVTETGGCQTLEGPLSMISPPGTKRALRAITDLVWITVHHNPTDTQDLAKLEKIVIADSYEEYHKFIDRQGNRFIKLLKRINLNFMKL